MPRLLLIRRPGEMLRLKLGETICWVGISTNDERKLCIEAPPEVEVTREEALPPQERRQRD